MNLIEDLKQRGLVHQCTDPSLNAHLESGSRTVYAGFDPTADSLHIGHLLGLVTLSRFQKTGHRPIAILGGATGMIGDPSGKSAERTLLTPEIIRHNVESIRSTVEKFLDTSGPNGAKLVNNLDWFQKMSFIDFLRETGKHFTINYMIAKDSVRSRLEDREQGISYTEFSYMLLQSYDFYSLYKEWGCTVQVGGSDQWGNITAGNELIRRMAAHQGQSEQPEVFGLTWPLVTKADGTKFGKSEGGNIWLSPDKTSAYQFYQFLVRSSDQDVIKYLKYYTFLTIEEINTLEEATRTQPEKRLAQLKLAKELTATVHGLEGVKQAEIAAEALFGGDVSTLPAVTIKEIFVDAPTSTVDGGRLEGAGLTLIDLLVETKLSSSKGEARKDIQGGGIYINNSRVTDIQAVVARGQLIENSCVVLRKGKKNYHLVWFMKK